jgi:hypothetical protein
MSISNPNSITINSVAKSLVRINQDNYGSEYLYREATYELRLKIRHVKEKPVSGQLVLSRHNIELTQTVYATSTAPQYTRQAYLILRNSDTDTAADVSYLAQGLVDFLTDANLGDLINWVN